MEFILEIIKNFLLAFFFDDVDFDSESFFNSEHSNQLDDKEKLQHETLKKLNMKKVFITSAVLFILLSPALYYFYYTSASVEMKRLLEELFLVTDLRLYMDVFLKVYEYDYYYPYENQKILDILRELHAFLMEWDFGLLVKDRIEFNRIMLRIIELLSKK